MFSLLGLGLILAMLLIWKIFYMLYKFIKIINIIKYS